MAVLLSVAPFGARAQDSTAPTGSPPLAAGAGVPGADAASQANPILTLDQDRLFRESAFGKAAIQRAEAETAALAAENREIETRLETEERDLTDRRATMSAADFAPLADAFDAKVEEIRAAQDAKSRAITRKLEEDRDAFFEAAVPVLGQILAETGAVAILSREAIILSLSTLDATDLAIARMDVALPPPAPPAP